MIIRKLTIICFSLLFSAMIISAHEGHDDEVINEEAAEVDVVEPEEEEDRDLYILFSPSFSMEQFGLFGNIAWDKLNMTSIDIDYTIFNSLNGSWGSYFRLSYNIPLTAKIDQLDQVEVRYNPTIATGMGVSIYVGAGYLLEFESMKLIFSVGPDFKLRILEGEFLLTVGGNIGTDLILQMGESFYMGFGFNFSADFWGYHNIGDESRYNPIAKPGSGIKILSHIGFKL